MTGLKKSRFRALPNCTAHRLVGTVTPFFVLVATHKVAAMLAAGGGNRAARSPGAEDAVPVPLLALKTSEKRFSAFEMQNSKHRHLHAFWVCSLCHPGPETAGGYARG